MKIIEDITHGGFGKVQLAKNKSGKQVILKTFDPLVTILSISPRETLLKRFVREVSVQKVLPNEYFMPILEYNITVDPPWFAMPIADRNFDEEITECHNKGKIPTEAISEIINALEKLHALGYTHRDLKPANILKHNSVWKLSDFGLVLVDSRTTGALTSPRSAWGSQYYSSPEQALDFRHVTSLADIYSFGAILHDIFAKCSRIPYSKLTCNGAIGPVIEKCTETKPQNRFKTMSAVRDALYKVIMNPSLPAGSHDAQTWIIQLVNLNTWDTQKIDNFIRFILNEASTDDKDLIFSSIDGNTFTQCLNYSEDLWNNITLEYCLWCFNHSFQFEYCDVVVSYLSFMVENGNIGIKANAIMAAAELGSNHNRWHVMGKVLDMCSPKMPTELAQRVAIEIIAQETQTSFQKCAELINKTKNEYHPIIANIL